MFVFLLVGTFFLTLKNHHFLKTTSSIISLVWSLIHYYHELGKILISGERKNGDSYILSLPLLQFHKPYILHYFNHIHIIRDSKKGKIDYWSKWVIGCSLLNAITHWPMLWLHILYGEISVKLYERLYWWN